MLTPCFLQRLKHWYRNHTGVIVRGKAKNVVADLKARLRANLQPPTRKRIHHSIEIFSTLYYKSDMVALVEQKTSDATPCDSHGQFLPETREEFSRRRLGVYREVINAAWQSATPEMKAEVEKKLEEERAAAESRKREEEESQDGETVASRTPEAYAE